MVVRGGVKGDEGHIAPAAAPAAFVPAHTCSYPSARSYACLVPLPLYLLTLVRTIPVVCLYTLRFVHDPCAHLVLVRSLCSPHPIPAHAHLSVPGAGLGLVHNPHAHLVPCCCCCCCRCHCTYTLTGSLVHVRLPCACPSLCGT